MSGGINPNLISTTKHRQQKTNIKRNQKLQEMSTSVLIYLAFELYEHEFDDRELSDMWNEMNHFNQLK